MPDGSPLHLPLTSLGMSDTFTRTAILNGYNTLADLLAIPLTELVQKGWFTTAMFEELARVVKDLHIRSTAN